MRQKGQVVTQDVDGYCGQHQNQAGPEAPVTVGASPVRMYGAGRRAFVPVLTVISFTHSLYQKIVGAP